ncbi:MAG: extracellular solute-binding protein [Treponemataceae bacterium]|nr:extracellular solute-binding protein [Treponemataceae bacterium]
MRKWEDFLGVLCLWLGTAVFLFASGQQDGTNKTGQTKELVEITQLVWDRGTIPADQGTIEDNWWTRYVNEKMAPKGIKVRFVPIPRAQETQKLPLMLAAGEAPDLCFTYDKNLLNLYVKNGALVDYTDLLAQKGTNILKISSNTDLEAGKINGRQYTFVCKSNGVADTTFIRKDWLDKLGLPLPKTMDEFYAVLKAFRDKDPGGVGDKLVPFALMGSPSASFTLWESVILPAFVKDPPSGERLVTPAPLWPEAKNAIAFLNKLYNEKLLGEFVVDKDGAIFKQKVIRGEIGAFISFGHWPYHPAYGSVYEKLKQNIPEAQLVSINPWKHPESKEYYVNFIRNSPYLYYFFSPKTAKRPDLVMEYLNWLASEEGYMVANLGLPGVDYTLINGVPQPIDPVKYTGRVSWIEPQYMAFRKPFANKGEESLYLRNAARLFPDNLRQQFINESTPITLLKYSTPPLNVPTPVADKYLVALQKKWEEALAKMVLSSPDKFNTLFDEAIRAYRAEGGDEVVKDLVNAYRQQYTK